VTREDTSVEVTFNPTKSLTASRWWLMALFPIRGSDTPDLPATRTSIGPTRYLIWHGAWPKRQNVGRRHEGLQMEAVLQTVFAALVGFIGGAGALLAQQRLLWRPQKRTELRYKALEDAIQALAMYEADALDAALQDKWQEYSGQGLRPHIVLRSETRVSMQKSLLQAKAYFPDDTFQVFDAALRCDVRLSNIPNTDFSTKSQTAISMMARDVGVTLLKFRAAENQKARRCTRVLELPGAASAQCSPSGSPSLSRVSRRLEVLAGRPMECEAALWAMGT
jgi:hypothetical protein